MSKHTPTPWQIGITLYPYVHFYGPSDAAGFSLAIGSCVTAFGKENDEANANFIVMAVNNHDALVGALKIARSWMPQEPGYDMPLACSDLAVVDTALRNVAVASEQGKS